MRKIITLISGVGLVISWLLFSGYSLANSSTPAAGWLMTCFVFGSVFGAAISPYFFKQKDGKKC
jgi:hypothetical protein